MKGMVHMERERWRRFRFLLAVTGLAMILVSSSGCRDKRAIPVVPDKTPLFMVTGLVR